MLVLDGPGGLRERDLAPWMVTVNIFAAFRAQRGSASGDPRGGGGGLWTEKLRTEKSADGEGRGIAGGAG